MPAQREPASRQSVRSPLRVWDLPTRAFHWSLVVLIGAAWFTAENGFIEWHAWIGQALLALMIYRLIWGLIGSQTAQFWDFFKGVAAAKAYARGLLHGKLQETVGHNPLGGLMVLLLLGLVTAQAVLGLFANDDIYFDGPLTHLVSKGFSDTLTGLHGLVFNLILAAALVHIGAVLFYLVVKRENLIRAMVTGYKSWVEPHPHVRFTPAWVALPALAVAAALVWAAVNYL
ncbi:MAG: cytochrome b/b6 domain-containing protein [Alphaproteobacteria bacterium]|nr:cytochrome b/b6 domain-containing protein [Alphaproteobacteria bacterium]MCB9930079.1 cytochrome b/b6 domain-containing protein [Alphaproteobacteria bacterium]